MHVINSWKLQKIRDFCGISKSLFKTEASSFLGSIHFAHDRFTVASFSSSQVLTIRYAFCSKESNFCITHHVFFAKLVAWICLVSFSPTSLHFKTEQIWLMTYFCSFFPNGFYHNYHLSVTLFKMSNICPKINFDKTLLLD